MPWPAVGAALSAAAPYVLGAASAGGQMATNRANREMAREQMRFQERMSNTSAQRAVADYRAAGLNPALAYGHPASSPGGAMATMGDPVSAGINSAQSARRTSSDLRNAVEQNSLLRASAQKALKEAAVAQTHEKVLGAQLLRQNMENSQLEIMQPFMTREAEARAILTELQIPEARANAALYNLGGAFIPGLNMGLGVLGTTAGAASRVFGAMRARPPVNVFKLNPFAQPPAPVSKGKIQPSAPPKQ